MDFGNVYYDPKDPGSYGGIERLHRAAGVSVKKATEYLRGQKTYQMHKPVRKNFKRRRYMVSGIDDLWQADLADMQKIKWHNGGYTFLLIVIDVFSKTLWVRPLKNKTAPVTLDGLDDIIISSNRKPVNFMTDRGTEFVNVHAKNYFKNLNINFYQSNNPETKAAVAERVIRTLKGRIYRYLTRYNTKRYIDVLQDLVEAYNNSKHRSIGMKPIDVTKDTEAQVRKKLYPIIEMEKPEFKLRLFDTVRIALTPSTFTKGYIPQWSEEVFVINKRKDTIPPTYRIQDENNETVTGSFYEPELQLIDERSPSEL